jgi:hypothetical protein
MLRSDPALQFLNFHKRNWIDGAKMSGACALGKFDPYHALEVKLFGRQLFNQLSNDTNLAIR